MPDSEQPRRFLAPIPCRIGDVVTLAPEQSRHMVTVLRIGAGQEVRIFTEQGDEFVARVEEAGAAAARVRVLREAGPAPSLAARLTLAFAPPPGQRAELLVEKATELGADVLQPLLCERLQAYQAAGAARRAEHWRRKAEDAARQSGRSRVPETCEPAPFEAFVREAQDELRLIGSTEAAPGLWPTLAKLPAAKPPASAVLIVGPAGGFTRRKLDLAAQSGFRCISLGPHILRVETAAIAMLAGRGALARGLPPAPGVLTGRLTFRSAAGTAFSRDSCLGRLGPPCRYSFAPWASSNLTMPL